MPKLIDLTGNRYGSLIVIGVDVGNPYSIKKWVCKCDCGVVKNYCGQHLREGTCKSCGCLHIKLLQERLTTHGQTTKGSIIPAEYRAWAGIKNRCYNIKDERYSDYGGRGIIVCDRWLNSYENFLFDMGRRPSEYYSIERNDVNGNYCPKNCRWATDIEQANNKRNSRRYEYLGETKMLNEWAAVLKANVSSMAYMLKTNSFEIVFEFLSKKSEHKFKTIKMWSLHTNSKSVNSRYKPKKVA